MAELISKEKVLWCLKASSEEIDWGQSEDGDAFKHYIGAVYRTIAIIKPEQPEQKHGHWIPIKLPSGVGEFGYKEYMVQEVTCSKCRFAEDVMASAYQYCPNCGAKMDEGVKQDDIQ